MSGCSNPDGQRFIASGNGPSQNTVEGRLNRETDEASVLRMATSSIEAVLSQREVGWEGTQYSLSSFSHPRDFKDKVGDHLSSKKRSLPVVGSNEVPTSPILEGRAFLLLGPITEQGGITTVAISFYAGTEAGTSWEAKYQRGDDGLFEMIGFEIVSIS
ncbi:MAG: hypothetical protein H8E31_13015 [Planctomycetes bacterium]|nr:hypothetical protein [Planctomycetota bacterium]